MATKTYAQLVAQTTVLDTDLLASYRGSGPLKSVTALIYKNYVGASYLALAGGTMTGALIHAVASEAAPNSFAGDTGTGFYRSGAGAFDISISGTRRFGLTSTGANVYGALAVSGDLSVGGSLTVSGSGSITGAVLSTALTKSTDYTLIVTDLGKTLILATGITTLTIPAYASVALPAGCEIYLYCLLASGSVSIAITSDTLNWYSGSAVTSGTRILAAGGWARLYKYTTTSWIITGDGIT